MSQRDFIGSTAFKTYLDIIQHHTPVDFEAIVTENMAKTASDPVGNLLCTFGASKSVHSFYGESECENRIYNAFARCLQSQASAGLTREVTSAHLILLVPHEAKRPVTMQEINDGIEKIIEISDKCEITFDVHAAGSHTDKVKAYLLAGCGVR